MTDVIIVDDFLNDDDLKSIHHEVEILSSEVKTEERGHASYKRVYLDEYYDSARFNSIILNLIQKKLFTEDIYKTARNINDLSFHLLEKSNYHETQLTFYGNSDEYKWHCDCGSDKSWSGRILNFIICINDKGFSGGNTLVSTTPREKHFIFESGETPKTDLIIKPKRGRLILMPAYLPHKVEPVIMKTNNIMNSRITINGHIGFSECRKTF